MKVQFHSIIGGRRMKYGWWTGKEYNDVKKWFADGMSIPYIAKKVDRDTMSVENLLVTERLIKISDYKYGGY